MTKTFSFFVKPNICHRCNSVTRSRNYTRDQFVNNNTCCTVKLLCFQVHFHTYISAFAIYMCIKHICELQVYPKTQGVHCYMKVYYIWSCEYNTYQFDPFSFTYCIVRYFQVPLTLNIIMTNVLLTPNIKHIITLVFALSYTKRYLQEQ